MVAPPRTGLWGYRAGSSRNKKIISSRLGCSAGLQRSARSCRQILFSVESAELREGTGDSRSHVGNGTGPLWDILNWACLQPIHPFLSSSVNCSCATDLFKTFHATLSPNNSCILRVAFPPLVVCCPPFSWKAYLQ